MTPDIEDASAVASDYHDVATAQPDTDSLTPEGSDDMNEQPNEFDSQTARGADQRTAEDRFRDEALSLIGPSLNIKGDLEAAEDLLIEGTLEGTVKHTSDRLIVGSSGQVRANIQARNLIIEGLVEGDILGSESVVIAETATVRGNISTPRISIADGAQFNGSIDMDTATATRH